MAQQFSTAFRTLQDRDGKWFASDVWQLFGQNLSSLAEVEARADILIAEVGLPNRDHFVPKPKHINSEWMLPHDRKLSEFDCYVLALCAGNGEQAKQARSYFEKRLGVQSESSRLTPEHMERIVLRKHIKEVEKALAEVIDNCVELDPEDFAAVINAGYQGLYGSTARELKETLGYGYDTKRRSPLDFMGVEELQLNLSRLSDTLLEISRQQPKTLDKLTRLMGEVAEHALNRFKENPDLLAPEDLMPAEDIHEVKVAFKDANKALSKKEKTR